ncbi:MAG TPA: OadG family transporter subunit [Paludibacteraceae bacterium]|jgi:oxaloacetate decarboxylase gamma subunit|nr:OadG family transporter subunit [Paludibacteraceae bacterium]HOU69525.1 OadG family transporter subunit [Paludibacteraceae bacterium]HPH63723.1 OadG family transporter subunit [Paludibacteraceae bacterium]
MEGNISEAIKLMFIGMTAVFVALILIILLGNLLIRLVNKYAPEEEKPVAKQSNIATINPNVAQAIKAAVNTIIGGKGAVTNIEKL